MNKNEFLDQLSANLKGISREDEQDILGDFIEHFKIGLEEGRTEEDLAASLGNPKVLAKQLRADILVKKAEEEASATNITRAVFASFGLGFFNLIFVLGPFIAIAAVLASLFAAAIAVAASGIAGFFASIFGPLFPEYFSLLVHTAIGIFGSIGVACLGVLFFIGDIYLAEILYKLFIRYIKFNLRIIKGRE